jgi:MFS family permease
MVLAVVATAEFLTTLMSSSVFMASKAFVDEWQVSSVTLSWISLVYILAVAALLMPAGKVADVIGRKRLFMLGMAVFSVFVFSSGFAPSPSVLIGLRLLTGLGTALLYSCTTALVALAYPHETRGRALGIQVTGTYLGLTLGPVVGGLIIDHLGWEWVFRITGILGAGNFLLTWWGTRGLEWREERRGRFDLGGSLAWAVALVVLLVGLSLLPGYLGIGLVVLGVLGLAGFILWETRAVDPVLDLSLFRKSRVFAFSNLAIFLSYVATVAPQLMLALYLELNLGLSERMAGLLMVAAPAVQAVFSPLVGRLADRVQPRFLSAGGMTVCLLALASFVSLGAETPRWFVAVACACLGLGFAFFSAPIMHSAMGSVDRRYSGMASATTATMRMTGQNVSLGLATVVMSLIVGRHSLDKNSAVDLAHLLTSVRVVFAILAGVCLLGVAASSVGPGKKPASE